MTRPSSLLWLTLLAVGAARLHAQGSTLVTGRVLANGAPITGAFVTISSFDRDTSVSATTSANGHYQIRFPRATEVIIISVILTGYSTQFRQLPRPASGELKVADIALTTNVQRLAAMRATVKPPPGGFINAGPRPGETQEFTDVFGDLNADLTGDLTGDQVLSLLGTPGISAGRDGMSFAGLGADQNQVSVNGSAYKGALPREAALMRAATSSYDPATGGAGVQTELYPIMPLYVTRRNVRMTVYPMWLQVAGKEANALGTRTVTPIVSGWLAGPIGSPALMSGAAYSLTFQGSRTVRPYTTLLDVDEAALRALSLHTDSVRRVLQVLPSLRIPTTAANAPGSLVTSDGRFLARIDKFGCASGAQDFNGDRRMLWNGGYCNSAWALFGGSWASTQGVGIGPSSTTLSSTTSERHALNARGLYSSYFHEAFVNESSVSLDVTGSNYLPLVAVPNATILISSRDPIGNDVLANTRVGGAGTAITRNSSMSAQVTNKTRWTMRDGELTPTVSLDAIINSESFDNGANLGSYVFNSIADFAANTPAVFTRILDARAGTVRGTHGAIGLGTQYEPSRRFRTQFGIREEVHSFSVPSSTRTPASTFGASRAPTLAAFSPMAGFSWNYGTLRYRDGVPDYIRRVYGGVRDYRALLTTNAVSSLLASSDIGTRLECVGSSAPAPDWEGFLSDSSAVPTQCSGPASALGSTGLSSAAFSKDFTLGHSWRGDLGWNFPLSAAVRGSVNGMFAMNTAQSEVIDANFNPVVYARLPDEGNRPMFVPMAAIAPTTGVVAIRESRRDPSVAFYNLRTPTGESRASRITAAAYFEPRPAHPGAFTFPATFSYTRNEVHLNQSGFMWSTAGDPRDRAIGLGDVSRHTVQLTTQARMPGLGTFSVGMQVYSGRPFTPIVSGDINGDGYGNDRAFIFDPAHSADTSLGRGMASLLATANSRIAGCLRRQLGSIAESGTCIGPWATRMNASFTFDAIRLHTPNRGSLSLHFANLPALADRILHGESGLRGWGPDAYPDPVLLSVRGFDPARQRFTYVVNPHFGESGYYKRIFGSPFRISIDASFALGANMEHAMMRSNFRAYRIATDGNRDSTFARLKRIRPPFFKRLTDSLSLAPAQMAAITRLGNAYETRRDSALRAYAEYVVSPEFRLESGDNARRWRELAQAVRWMQFDLKAPLRAILTDDQWLALPRLGLGIMMWEREDVVRALQRWQSGIL